MFNESHNLANELPEFKDKIHELKTKDNHFRKLFEEYHVVDDEIHRIEQGIENHADEYTEELKKKRLSLKDELYNMLQAAA